MVPPPPSIAEGTGDLAVLDIPGKGRGVVARRAFRVGALVERAPVLVVEPAIIAQSILTSYAYKWDGYWVIVMGYGMIYNHSNGPNVRYDRDIYSATMTYTAITEIESGQELLINYNDDPRDQTAILFDGGNWRRVGES